MVKQDQIDFSDDMDKKISILLNQIYKSEEDFDNQVIDKKEFSTLVQNYLNLINDYSKKVNDFFDYFGESDLFYNLYEELFVLKRELSKISKNI